LLSSLAGLSLAAVSYLLLTVILVLELQDKLVLTARCERGSVSIIGTVWHACMCVWAGGDC
jgi:hypothetical protein